MPGSNRTLPPPLFWATHPGPPRKKAPAEWTEEIMKKDKHKVMKTDMQTEPHHTAEGTQF